MIGRRLRGLGRYVALGSASLVVLGVALAGCGGGSSGGDANYTQVFEKGAAPPPAVQENEKVNPKEKESPRERRAKKAASG